jgi:hypothetical protein
MTSDTAQRPGAPAVEHQVPHGALLKVVNPIFAAVLRSPLHGLLDGFRPRILVLGVTGRRTGRRYRIVVGRHEIGGIATIFTSSPWRANLRGGADVEVTFDGSTFRTRAVLVEEPDAVADAYTTVIERLGWKAAQRQIGIRVNVGRTPTHAELVAAVDRDHLSLVHLQPGKEATA